jgi:hypothetical protein
MEFDPSENELRDALSAAIRSDFYEIIPIFTASPKFSINCQIPRCNPIGLEDGGLIENDPDLRLPGIHRRMNSLAAVVLLDMPRILGAMLQLDDIDFNVKTPDGEPVLWGAAKRGRVSREVIASERFDLKNRDRYGKYFPSFHRSIGS